MDTESNNQKQKQKQDKLPRQAVKIWFFIPAFFIMITMCLIMCMNFGFLGVGLILLIIWSLALFLAGLILLIILAMLLVNNVVLSFDTNYKKASEAYKMCNFRNAILYYEEFIKDKRKLKKRSFIIYRLIMLYCYFEEYDKALAILNQYKDFYSDAVVNLNLSLLKISILNEQKSLSEVYAEMENLKGIIEGININTIKKSAEQTYELLKIEVLLSEDEIDKAIDCFNSIPKKHQDESYYILKGHIARKQNNLEDAAKSYLYCYTKTKDPLKKAFYLKSILECEK